MIPVLSSALRGRLALLALVALLAACGSSARKDFDLNAGDAEAENAAESAMAERLFDDWFGSAGADSTWEYTINEGDHLEVTFFTHPEQNRFVRVRPDGRISMPYVGELVVAGHTAAELSATLRQRYSEVLVKPQVDVLVHEMGGAFYVLGAVNAPGEFNYERPLTLTQALARAGGYSGEARLNNLVLLRRTPDGRGMAAILDFGAMMQSADKRGDIRLRPFDIVWVPKDMISRWDNATGKLLTGVIQSEDILLKGWTLANFNEVYRRDNRP